MITQINDYPIPLDQDEIDTIWDERQLGEPPHIDEVHEEYIDQIAEYASWTVFRVKHPLGSGDMITFWNRNLGQGIQIADDAGSWHVLVNLFAEIVDEEGDCRDEDVSESLTPTGNYNQQCESCGESWTIG